MRFRGTKRSLKRGISPAKTPVSGWSGSAESDQPLPTASAKSSESSESSDAMKYGLSRGSDGVPTGVRKFRREGICVFAGLNEV